MKNQTDLSSASWQKNTGDWLKLISTILGIGLITLKFLSELEVPAELKYQLGSGIMLIGVLWICFLICFGNSIVQILSSNKKRIRG